MNIKTILFAFVFLLETTISVFGTVMTTRLQQAVEAINYALDSYAKSNQGKLPTSWAAIDRFLIGKQIGPSHSGTIRSHLFNTVDECLGVSLEEGFTLLTSHSVLLAEDLKRPDRSFAQIVALMNSPVDRQKDKIRGRYLVWRNTTGRFGLSFLQESEVAGLFLKAGAPIPTGPVKTESQRTMDDDFHDYAVKNFKNPAAPTPTEFKAMADHFGGTENQKSLESLRNANTELRQKSEELPNEPPPSGVHYEFLAIALIFVAYLMVRRFHKNVNRG